MAVCRAWRQLSRPGPLWAAIALADWGDCSTADEVADVVCVRRTTAATKALRQWLQRHAPLLQQLHCNGTHAWMQV